MKHNNLIEECVETLLTINENKDREIVVLEISSVDNEDTNFFKEILKNDFSKVNIFLAISSIHFAKNSKAPKRKAKKIVKNLNKQAKLDNLDIKFKYEKCKSNTGYFYMIHVKQKMVDTFANFFIKLMNTKEKFNIRSIVSTVFSTAIIFYLIYFLINFITSLPYAIVYFIFNNAIK